MRNESVTYYINQLPAERQTIMNQIREVIFTLYPTIEEGIEHNMPSYKSEGRTLCHMASQKHYISVYMNTALVEKYREKLSKITGIPTGKSCVRFCKPENFPKDLIKIILEENKENYIIEAEDDFIPWEVIR